MAIDIPKIDPEDVTIDNIGNFQQKTIETIDQIKNIDISDFEDKITELENFYKKQRRFFSKIQPTGIEEGTIWFREKN